MLRDQDFLDSTNKIIRDAIKEYSVLNFAKGEVDDDTLNWCKYSINPILLLQLTLVKVRKNTIQFSAQKRKTMEDHLSELLDYLGNLEKQVNNCGEPLPHILEEIQLLKERHKRKVKKQDLKTLIILLLN